MNEIILDAYAKINLSLDVLYKRNDGYHELEMIMQQINLKDIITLRKIPKGIKITCNNPKVPLDSSNLVYKAYVAICNRCNIHKGVWIDIDKNIPIAGGLAGGSADAAAVLKGLNQLWELKLEDKELMSIGEKIGSDVPFCIIGGTALAKGRGEKLKELKNFKDKWLLIANPDLEVSTAYVYGNLNLSNINTRPNTKEIIKCINNDDIAGVSKRMVNVLESVTIKEYPVINEIKESMLKFGALGSMMSGSGPTVFGIFKGKTDAVKCYNILKDSIKQLIISKTM